MLVNSLFASVQLEFQNLLCHMIPLSPGQLEKYVCVCMHACVCVCVCTYRHHSKDGVDDSYSNGGADRLGNASTFEDGRRIIKDLRATKQTLSFDYVNLQCI